MLLLGALLVLSTRSVSQALGGFKGPSKDFFGITLREGEARGGEGLTSSAQPAVGTFYEILYTS